jgi:hypothetical protein
VTKPDLAAAAPVRAPRITHAKAILISAFEISAMITADRDA